MDEFIKEKSLYPNRGSHMDTRVGQAKGSRHRPVTRGYVRCCWRRALSGAIRFEWDAARWGQDPLSEFDRLDSG